MNAMSQSTYPLTSSGFIIGAVAGGATALVAPPLIGAAVFVLCAGVGLTWRRNETPILPFILVYQWVAITIGLIYGHWVGPVPTVYPPGDVQRTVLLSLAGLGLLAVGMRMGAGGQAGRNAAPIELSERGFRLLFWIVFAVFAADYLYVLNPRAYFGAGVLVEKSLLFRNVLLLGLWMAAIARPGRMPYLIVSFLWVLIPAFGSYYSHFKTPVFLLVLAASSTWAVWDREWWRRHSTQTLAIVPVVCAAIAVAILWQGAVKQEAREAQDEGWVGGSPIERVEFFIDSAQTNLPGMLDDAQSAIGELVERLSYITFFSRVLEHTPAVEPHADGELLWMAVVNGTVPRFLFRDKPELPSDSAYTRRFAGIRVADSSSANVSVSIGYMAEFYADWGLNGMFVSVLFYGIWTGLLHRGIRYFVGMPLLVNGVLVVVLMSTMTFEHQFVRGFASLNMGFAVAVGLALVAGPVLRRILEVEGRRVAPVIWGAPPEPDSLAGKLQS